MSTLVLPVFTSYIFTFYILAADFSFFPGAFTCDGDKGHFPGTGLSTVIVTVFVRHVACSRIAISSGKVDNFIKEKKGRWVNFLFGQAKLAIYVSRKKRLDTGQRCDCLLIIKCLVRTRVLMEYKYMKMENLAIYRFCRYANIIHLFPMCKMWMCLKM